MRDLVAVLLPLVLTAALAQSNTVSAPASSVLTADCYLQALSRADIAPALETLKKKLMERNVAEEIADK
jgi:hypothetical protein